MKSSDITLTPHKRTVIHKKSLKPVKHIIDTIQNRRHTLKEKDEWNQNADFETFQIIRTV